MYPTGTLDMPLHGHPQNNLEIPSAMSRSNITELIYTHTPLAQQTHHPSASTPTVTSGELCADEEQHVHRLACVPVQSPAPTKTIIKMIAPKVLCTQPCKPSSSLPYLSLPATPPPPQHPRTTNSPTASHPPPTHIPTLLNGSPSPAYRQQLTAHPSGPPARRARLIGNLPASPLLRLAERSREGSPSFPLCEWSSYVRRCTRVREVLFGFAFVMGKRGWLGEGLYWVGGAGGKEMWGRGKMQLAVAEAGTDTMQWWQ